MGAPVLRKRVSNGISLYLGEISSHLLLCLSHRCQKKKPNTCFKHFLSLLLDVILNTACFPAEVISLASLSVSSIT